jgi:hypothetical protein
MKNIRNPNKNNSDDLLPEYDFDYSKARPNRFADKMNQDSLVVLVDPDVAKVFNTPEAVNNALRAIIHAIPGEIK